MLLSATTYLVATNQAINFIEQREAVGLTLQVAVAVGALLSLLAAADAVSGERDRGSLETLLLAPIPRWQLVVGKGASALSLWLAAFAVAVPYVWFLGHGIDLVAVPLAAGLAGRHAARGRVRRPGPRGQLGLGDEPGQPRRLHAGAARALRADAVPGRRDDRLGGRAAPAVQPAHRRPALPRAARDRRPRGGRGAVVARRPGRVRRRRRARGGGRRPAASALGGAANEGARAPAAVVVAALAAVGAGGVGPRRRRPRITLDRGPVAVRLGTTFAFTSTLSAGAAADRPARGPPERRLARPRRRTSIPEDWSTHRTRYLGPVAPGDSRSIRWSVKAVSSGPIAIYVTAVPAGGSGPIAVGPPLHVQVADRRTLNSGGVVPLALAVPAAVALVAVRGSAPGAMPGARRASALDRVEVGRVEPVEEPLGDGGAVVDPGLCVALRAERR